MFTRRTLGAAGVRTARLCSPPAPAFLPSARRVSSQPSLPPADPPARASRSAIFSPDYPTKSSLRASKQDAQPDEAWRLDPYTVMASSPVRQCIVSRQKMPSEFMFRMRPVVAVTKDSTGNNTERVRLLADRMQHPLFQPRRAGQSVWAALNPDAVKELGSSSSPASKAIMSAFKTNDIEVAGRLGDQVHHQLRERVAQELLLLNEGVREGNAPAVLRALTPDEVEKIRSGSTQGLDETATGRIIAILDLEGTNPGHDGMTEWDPLARGTLLPGIPVPLLGRELEPVVPLYPIKRLFAERAPRIAALIRDVLSAEEHEAWQSGTANQSPTQGVEGHRAKVEESILVAVTVPTEGKDRDAGVALAVALWRIRLWEGQGWEVEKRAGKRGGGTETTSSP